MLTLRREQDDDESNVLSAFFGRFNVDQKRCFVMTKEPIKLIQNMEVIYSIDCVYCELLKAS